MFSEYLFEVSAFHSSSDPKDALRYREMDVLDSMHDIVRVIRTLVQSSTIDQVF